MPKFGWDDFTSPTGKIIFKDKIFYNKFICNITNGLQGKAESITINYYSYAYNVKTRCALYDNEGNFIAETEERTLSSTGGTYQPETFNFNPKPTLFSGEYILAIWGNNSGRIAIQDQTEYSFKRDDETYNGFPNPLIADETYNNNVPHIYCTFTESITLQITDTHSLVIAVIEHGSADISNVVAPSQIEPEEPFDIIYNVTNIGTISDTLYGHILNNDGNEIEGTGWTQEIPPGETITIVFNHPGLTENLNAMIEAGHSPT